MWLLLQGHGCRLDLKPFDRDRGTAIRITRPLSARTDLTLPHATEAISGPGLMQA
jgi:hypothetical protein